jgi:hypothetical protein
MTTNDELRRKIAELEELAQVLGSKAEFLRETRSSILKERQLFEDPLAGALGDQDRQGRQVDVKEVGDDPIGVDLTRLGEVSLPAREVPLRGAELGGHLVLASPQCISASAQRLSESG